jgi:hypothetical protein
VGDWVDRNPISGSGICCACVASGHAAALANKMARLAWALLAHSGTYRAPELAQAA